MVQDNHHAMQGNRRFRRQPGRHGFLPKPSAPTYRPGLVLSGEQEALDALSLRSDAAPRALVFALLGGLTAWLVLGGVIWSLIG